MTTAVTSLFLIGWIELFNVPGITMMMIFLPLVKRRAHLWIYIAGSYIAFASASIAIFLGIDRIVTSLYAAARTHYPSQLAAGLLAAAAGTILSAILITRYIVKSFRTKTEMSFTSALKIRSAHPAVILLLSFTSVWCGIPAFASLWAYLAVLAGSGVSFSSAVILLCIYCSITSIPLIIVYILLCRMSGERFQAFMSKLTRICTNVSMISLPLIFGFVAVWCIFTAVQLL